jgi:hypothetical protein
MTLMAPLLAALLAVTQPAAQPALAEPVPADGGKSGTIIIYRRGSVVGAALGCPVRYEGSDLVELGRSKAFIWQVSPGRHILGNKTSSVEVNVEPGETRYVRCQIKSGFMTGRADLQIVDGTEYATIKDELEAPGT